MLIAQITDLHLGFEPDDPGELNQRRLEQTLSSIAALRPRPDLLIVSGDLADRGEVDAYARLRASLAPLDLPCLLTVGNHDRRAAFAQVFPETPVHDGFIQYVVEDRPLRIIVTDTVSEDRHGGAFCEARAQWLRARLEEAPKRPTLLVLHHPPVPTGIAWMTCGPHEAWTMRLRAVVADHPQIVAAISGHVHRPMVAPWAGTTLVVCPSTAPQVALTLTPMTAPDARALILEAPPAYALHAWSDEGLVSHFVTVESPPVLARYDAALAPVVAAFIAEIDAPGSE